jgi:hypothetical protein
MSCEWHLALILLPLHLISLKNIYVPARQLYNNSMSFTVDFGTLQLLELDSNITLCCHTVLNFAHPTNLLLSEASSWPDDPKMLKNFWIARGQGMSLTLEILPGMSLLDGRSLGDIAKFLCQSEVRIIWSPYIFALTLIDLARV